MHISSNIVVDGEDACVDVVVDGEGDVFVVWGMEMAGLYIAAAHKRPSRDIESPSC